MSYASAASAALLVGLVCGLILKAAQHSMGSAQSGAKEAAAQQQDSAGGGGGGGSGASAPDKLGAGLLLT